MHDNVIRAVRTFFQAFTGVLLVQAVPILADATNGKYVLDIDWLKRVGVSAVAAGTIALVTWTHNALEDATGKTLGPVPTDRTIGDKALGAGVGSK